MFEDKFAKLPEESSMTSTEIDPAISNARNNGLVSSSTSKTRKRKRRSSKHNSSAGGHTSSMRTSSDDDASTDESSDDIENNRENTLRQLYSLQEQVKFINENFYSENWARNLFTCLVLILKNIFLF